MIGLILFIDSLGFLPHFVLLLPVVYLVIKQRGIKLSLDRNLMLLVAIMIISLFIRLLSISIDTKNFNSIEQLFPWFLFNLLVYYIAINLDKSDLKIFIILVIFETIIGIIQFNLGIESFFVHKKLPQQLESGLLYFRSVYGLSTTSSGFSQKIFLGIMFIELCDIERSYKNIMRLILLVGMIVTFNRTCIISVFAFYTLYYIYHVHKKKIIYLIAPLSLICIALYEAYDYIIYQMSRGFSIWGFEGILASVGRMQIWEDAIEFISSHLWLGNGTVKYFFIKNDFTYHMHNSYLELLTTSGLLIFIAYMFIILININKRNIIYVVPLMIYSFFQYGFFWGISLADITLFFLLFNKEFYKPKEQPLAINSVSRDGIIVKANI